MPDQNLNNHARYVPLFHFITSAAVILLFIGSIINLVHSSHEQGNLYAASLILLISLILGSFFFYIRQFPLKVQDRAIRAEENLRHFILTGKPLDNRLSMGQIIALRFASDEEMPNLAKKAAEENLSSKDIKSSIKNWRPDHHRA